MPKCEFKERFDKLFEGWDSKLHRIRKNNKTTYALEYYLMTEIGSNLPADEVSPHVSITENHMEIFSQYRCINVIYTGKWLPDLIMQEIIQSNVEKLDLILYRRQLKRLEGELSLIDSNKKLTKEEKLIEKNAMDEQINELKAVLKLYSSDEIQEKPKKIKAQKKK